MFIVFEVFGGVYVIIILQKALDLSVDGLKTLKRLEGLKSLKGYCNLYY